MCTACAKDEKRKLISSTKKIIKTNFNHQISITHSEHSVSLPKKNMEYDIIIAPYLGVVH